MSAQRVDELALYVTDTMTHASRSRERLQEQIDGIVNDQGYWSKALAGKILSLTIKIVEAGVLVSSTMTAAYHEAFEEASKMSELAQEFVQDHPIFVEVVCVIVALGILSLLCPWVIEALGFTGIGPLEGKT
jgi:hypothetical protein